MKKKVSLLFLAMLPLFFGCSKTDETSSRLCFEKSEYTIHSGDTVFLDGDYTYAFLGDIPENVSLDSKTGKITFGEDVPNYTQVLYQAFDGSRKSDPIVLTLIQEKKTPTLSFINLSSRLCSGDYVLASSSTGSSISYRLKEKVRGVQIDTSTGQVTYQDNAKENDAYTVVIESDDAKEEKIFHVAKDNLVKASLNKQVSEASSTHSSYFTLDFSAVPNHEDQSVLGVLYGNKLAEKEDYVYDNDKKTLAVRPSLLEKLSIGENTLTIVTPRNPVRVTWIKATKILMTAEDLFSINDSVENLRGYYVLGKDIDLSESLKTQRFKPIGIYQDKTDGTAQQYAFKGTFDGNGHTISGLLLNQTGELAFNCGLFGYVNNLAVIRNLGVKGKGTSVVKSFSGGMVGVNEGRIENCFADVDLQSDALGENAYHMIGGFCGRNLGTIESCYALGRVEGDSEIGAFVGRNEGEISHCYALKSSYPSFGEGIPGEETSLFGSESQFIQSSNNLSFDPTYWEIKQGSLPQLKTYIPYLYPYDLKIIDQGNYTLGDTISLKISLAPSSFEKDYLTRVEVTTDDPGIEVNGFTLITKNATKKDVHIQATLSLGEDTLQDEILIHLYEKPTSLTITDDLPSYLEPGERYRLRSQIEPYDANPRRTWSFVDPSVTQYGFSLDGNILTVSEKVEYYTKDYIDIKVSASGLSATKRLSILKPHYLTNTGAQILYSDDIHPVSYTFPDSVSLEGAKLYRFHKECEATISGQTVTINSNLLTQVPDRNICFTLRLQNGSYYRLYASYRPHKKETGSSQEKEIFVIKNVQDFKTYFNLTEANYSESKYAYYDKTFVLQGDIDFASEKIYSLGFDDPKSKAKEFKGKIYGNDHVIKNARIEENEGYLGFSAEEKKNNYRASKYRVGFFTAFQGEIHDVTFDNLKVGGNSWNGVFAGTIEEGAILEHVTIQNSRVTNGNGDSFSSKDYVTGKFSSSYLGKEMIACTFDGSEENLIGERIR